MPVLDLEQTERTDERGAKSKDDRAIERDREEEPPLTESGAFTLGRALYGGILAFMALDNLRNLDERAGYAESKGVPMAERSVKYVSGSLLAGSLGIAAWRLPRAAAVAVMTFFVSVTPVMHDFWTLDDEQETQQQMTHFLKNAALLGGALAFFGVASAEE